MNINRMLSGVCAVIIISLFYGFAFCSDFTDLLQKADSAAANETKIEYYTKALAAWDSSDTAEALASAYNRRGNAYYSRGHKHNRDLLDMITANDGYTNRESLDKVKEIGPAFEKAEEDYSNAIKSDPGKAYLYRNRGNVYYYLEKKKKAISDFDRAIELDPNYSAAYYDRGFTYKSMKKLELAESDFAKANEFDPEYLLKRGGMLAMDGKYDEAMIAFNRSIELQPGYAGAYNNRGLVHLRKGSFNEAIRDFAKAIELEPKGAFGYVNRGGAHNKKGMYDKAIEDYNKAIELEPDSLAAYSDRGNTYYNRGSYDKAIDDYNKAIDLKNFTKPIELKPKEASGYLNLVSAHTKKDKIDKFNKYIEDYSKLPGLKPDDVVAYRERGLTCDEQGSYYKVVNDHDKAAGLAPTEWDYLHKNRRQVYEKYTSQFLETCRKARPQKYNEVTEEMRRLAVQGDALAEDEKYGDAITRYRQALEQGFWFATARYNLANMYAAQKDYERAILHMKCYMEFAPDEAGTRAAKDAIYGWEAKAAIKQ